MTTDALKVTVEGRHVPGPRDLYGLAGPGSTVSVSGSPAEQDGARWAPAIGSAVLRGASVERR